MLNLLIWCDEKISYLKSNGIRFENGLPILPAESYYKDIPESIVPFMYRNDIPPSKRSKSLLCFFNNDKNLLTRIEKLDKETAIMKEYGGICGFDLSPSIGMLRPRQNQSIQINAVYDCFCAVNGIKVMPNMRIGDYGTLKSADRFLSDSNFIIGQLGCQNHGFKNYGYHQLSLLLENNTPSRIFVYGNMTLHDAQPIIQHYGVEVFVYPDRRSYIRNGKKPFIISQHCNTVSIRPLGESVVGGVA